MIKSKIIKLAAVPVLILIAFLAVAFLFFNQRAPRADENSVGDCGTPGTANYACGNDTLNPDPSETSCVESCASADEQLVTKLFKDINTENWFKGANFTSAEKKYVEYTIKQAVKDIYNTELLNPYFTDPELKNRRSEERLKQALEKTSFRDMKMAGECSFTPEGDVDFIHLSITLTNQKIVPACDFRAVATHELLHAIESPDTIIQHLTEDPNAIITPENKAIFKKYKYFPINEGLTELVTQRIAREQGYSLTENAQKVYKQDQRIALAVEEAIKRNIVENFSYNPSQLDHEASRYLVNLFLYRGIENEKYFDRYVGQSGAMKNIKNILIKESKKDGIDKVVEYINSIKPGPLPK